MSKLTEYQERFLNRRISDGSKEIYRRAFGYFTQYSETFEIAPIDAEGFVNQLENRSYRGQKVSATTVNIYLRHIKAFFAWLVDMEVLDKNPFRKVKFLKTKSPGKDLYEDWELRALLKACPGDRWRLILTLAITTSMRAGEILNLTIPEINYHDKTITIQPKQDTEHTWKWELKDREIRTVPLTDEAERLLLLIQSELPEGQPYVCLKPERYQHLLKGTHYRKRKCPECNFRRTFLSICNRAGVKNKTFHALRGSSLTILLENDLRPHEVKEIAGHSSEATTYGYIRPRNEYISRARAIFNQWAIQDSDLRPSD